MSDKPVILTQEQAISMLDPEAEYIHSYANPGAGMLIGADHTRANLLDDIESAESLQLGGQQCQAINHGLVMLSRGRLLFVECKDGFDYDAFAKQVTP